MYMYAGVNTVMMNDDYSFVFVFLLAANAMDVNEIDEDQFEDVADD